jgi:hypothetical protein
MIAAINAGFPIGFMPEVYCGDFALVHSQ